MTDVAPDIDAPGDDAVGDAADAPDGQDQQPGDTSAELAKWKAMARKHEAQAKANAGAAKSLQEMEEAGKSESEKLSARLARAEAAAKAAEIKALKAQVALDKGLKPSLAKYLPDLDDEVDLIEAAEDLLANLGQAPDAPARQPKSTLTSPLGDGDDPAAQRDRLLKSMLGQSAS